MGNGAASKEGQAPEPGWRVAWLRALVDRVGRRWTSDDCGQRAASIAYYALLSFFPFVILLASVASLIVGDDAAEIRRALEPLHPLLPELGSGFWERVQDLVDRRGLLSVGSIVGLVFLATRVMVSVERSLGAIFHDGGRSRRRAHAVVESVVAHAMTIAALVLLGLVLTFVALLEIALHATASPVFLREAVRGALFTRHAVPIGLLSLLAYGLLSVVPSVPIRHRWRLVGAVFFALAHDAAVSLWARIVGLLAPRDLVYGSFVGAVSFAAWTWVAASLLLLTAELVADLNGNRAEDPSDRPPARARPGAGRRRRTA